MVGEIIAKCGVVFLIVGMIALAAGILLSMFAPQAGTVALYVALFAVCIGMPIGIIGVVILLYCSAENLWRPEQGLFFVV